MLDLNKIVNDSLVKIAAEGYVEKVVEKRLKESIESVIDDLFRSYSDFGKNLKKEVGEKLKVNLGELKLDGYNVMVLNAVKAKLDEAIHIQGVERIKGSLDNLLVDVKKEYKLSELIEEMKRDATEYNDDHYGEEISFHIDPDSSVLSFIYFDPDEDKEKYQCQYRLVLDKDGSMNSISIGDRKFDNRLIMGGLHGFEETLFKIYSTGAKIIIDENNVDVEYGYNDED